MLLINLLPHNSKSTLQCLLCRNEAELLKYILLLCQWVRCSALLVESPEDFFFLVPVRLLSSCSVNVDFLHSQLLYHAWLPQHPAPGAQIVFSAPASFCSACGFPSAQLLHYWLLLQGPACEDHDGHYCPPPTRLLLAKLSRDFVEECLWGYRFPVNSFPKNPRGWISCKFQSAYFLQVLPAWHHGNFSVIPWPWLSLSNKFWISGLEEGEVKPFGCSISLHLLLDNSSCYLYILFLYFLDSFLVVNLIPFCRYNSCIRLSLFKLMYGFYVLIRNSLIQ